MPLVRPCRHPWCPNYQPCPRHPVIPFAGTGPMPPGWAKLRAACLARDGGMCVLCGAPATDADHIVPRAQGGSDDLANLRSLCHRCHLRRAGR
jgi:5-methylcytosine-specific restriction endonuclease McrA